MSGRLMPITASRARRPAPRIEGAYFYRGKRFEPVSPSLKARDRLGSLRMRLGLGRMRYAVPPGLYARGKPGPASPVFVTANYTMSFDALRSALAGLEAWILVLDTKGVNVWCAAGKGSFGTEELLQRIEATRLPDMVDHRELILPQLGAPGVSAPELARRSGFKAVWGPVRAADIGPWLAAGRRKDEAMRTVRFSLPDRLTVALLELVQAWPATLIALGLGSLLALPASSGWAGRAAAWSGLFLGGVLTGTIATPALLPYLPGKAFAVKGATVGAAWALVYGLTGLHFLGDAGPLARVLAVAGGVLATAPVSAFLAMNFTGASTFTCQPGALLEVEKGFGPMLGSAAAGLAALAAAKFLGA